MPTDVRTDLAPPATNGVVIRPSTDEPAPSLGGIPGVLTRQGWEPPADLSFDRWLSVGETFRTMEESVMWWLGDWWRFGHRTWGEMASQGVREAVSQATGYSVKTAQNAAWVAERFPTEESRSLGVPWSFHADAASLPPDERVAMLEVAVSDDLDRDQLRARVKERRQQLRAEEYARLPLPSADPPGCILHLADARGLPLEAGTVDLIITSPPYALEKSYTEGDVAPTSWLAFMKDVLTELLRVTAQGGRLALNVPLDTTLGGFRPTYAQAVAVAVKVGWTYRTTVVWHDDQLGKSVARGSVDSATAPHLIAPIEHVAIFSNGSWKREASERPSDIDHADWLAWTNGFWQFPGESSPWEGHPAPFPVELPRRLLSLLSFPGDLVLDPFVGSGTTAVAALASGRDFVGADISETYLASTRRRIARQGTAFGGRA